MMYVDKARNATVNIGDRDLKTDVSRSVEIFQLSKPSEFMCHHCHHIH